MIWLLTRKKVRLQNFRVILQISDHECHGQTCLNVVFVMFGIGLHEILLESSYC